MDLLRLKNLTEWQRKAWHFRRFGNPDVSGLYDAYPNPEIIAFKPTAWLNPGDGIVSTEHPKELAIPLYTIQQIGIEREEIFSLGLEINLANCPKTYPTLRDAGKLPVFPDYTTKEKAWVHCGEMAVHESTIQLHSLWDVTRLESKPQRFEPLYAAALLSAPGYRDMLVQLLEIPTFVEIAKHTWGLLKIGFLLWFGFWVSQNPTRSGWILALLLGHGLFSFLQSRDLLPDFKVSEPWLGSEWMLLSTFLTVCFGVHHVVQGLPAVLPPRMDIFTWILIHRASSGWVIASSPVVIAAVVDLIRSYFDPFAESILPKVTLMMILGVFGSLHTFGDYFGFNTGP